MGASWSTCGAGGPGSSRRRRPASSGRVGRLQRSMNPDDPGAHRAKPPLRPPPSWMRCGSCAPAGPSGCSPRGRLPGHRGITATAPSWARSSSANHGPELAHAAAAFGMKTAGFLGLAIGLISGLSGLLGAYAGASSRTGSLPDQPQGCRDQVAEPEIRPIARPREPAVFIPNAGRGVREFRPVVAEEERARGAVAVCHDGLEGRPRGEQPEGPAGAQLRTASMKVGAERRFARWAPGSPGFIEREGANTPRTRRAPPPRRTRTASPTVDQDAPIAIPSSIRIGPPVE